MHLVQQVVFDYTIHHKIGINCGNFESIDELRTAVQNSFRGGMEIVTVSGVCQIIDTDKKEEATGVEKFFINKKPKPHTILSQDSIDFIVADKLMYPRDIREMLTQQYGSTFDFDKTKYDENKPVFFRGVSERTQYGLRNPKNGAPTQYTLRNVHCHPLSENRDIVVDKNLGQIWPENENKGKIPVALTKLLTKQKEKIYEG